MENPVKPKETDCCGSGCNPCIFDVYEAQCKTHEANKKLATTVPKKNCIGQTYYTTFVLIERKQHTKNTFIYSFRCELTEDVLFYNPGQHFLLRSPDGKFTRAYTPIPSQLDSFSFSVLIKLYKDGLMSNFLRNLEIGTKTLWRGPYGDFVLNFSYKHILGIVQGTGIAPIYAIFSTLINNVDCETFLQLFCCFRDSDDFLLHDELYSLASNWNFMYKVFLNCNLKPKCAKYNEEVYTRRLCVEDVERFLLGKDLFKVQVLICGSKEFNESWLKVVKNCKVLEKNIHVF